MKISKDIDIIIDSYRIKVIKAIINKKIKL
jgi:hypothetical protein